MLLERGINRTRCVALYSSPKQVLPECLTTYFTNWFEVKGFLVAELPVYHGKTSSGLNLIWRMWMYVV